MDIPKIQRTSKPDNSRVQRLRIQFGKQGSMTLISHLDFVRLLDRALRRASLPISFTGGFHPGPRIAPANALPLGMSSSGELVDFELTQAMEPEAFRAQLAAQLPSELPLYAVEDIPLKSPSVTQRLALAEYVIWLEADLNLKQSAEAESDAASEALAEAQTNNPLESEQFPLSEQQWQQWVDELMAAEVVELEKTTKSGKVKQFNGRDRLQSLELAPSVAQEQGWAIAHNQMVLRYRGSCRNDGTLLRPEQLLSLLEKVAQQLNNGVAPQFHLLQAHRCQLLLDPEPPQVPTPAMEVFVPGKSQSKTLASDDGLIKAAPFEL